VEPPLRPSTPLPLLGNFPFGSYGCSHKSLWSFFFFNCIVFCYECVIKYYSLFSSCWVLEWCLVWGCGEWDFRNDFSPGFILPGDTLANLSFIQDFPSGCSRCLAEFSMLHIPPHPHLKSPLGWELTILMVRGNCPVVDKVHVTPGSVLSGWLRTWTLSAGGYLRSPAWWFWWLRGSRIRKNVAWRTRTIRPADISRSCLPVFIHLQLATAPTLASQWAQLGQAWTLTLGTRSGTAAPPQIWYWLALQSGSVRAMECGVGRNPFADVSIFNVLLGLHAQAWSWLPLIWLFPQSLTLTTSLRM
jgi:hypothetical protein